MTKFRKLTMLEAAQVFELVKARMVWMDEKELDSWNHEGYDKIFPLEHYEELARQNLLFGLVNDDGKVLCSAALMTSDDMWPDGKPALYIHRFVSDVNIPGIGSEFLSLMDDYARKSGFDRIRLDVKRSNAKMNAYYEKHGFLFVGEGEDGDYKGNLREKVLPVEKHYEFDAVLHETPENGGAYVIFPWNIRDEFGMGRVKVHAEFDGIPYDGSIVNMGVKDANGVVCYIIGVLKSIRQKLGKKDGDSLHVVITASDN